MKEVRFTRDELDAIIHVGWFVKDGVKYQKQLKEQNEPYFDRERIKQLNIILVFWNAKDISDSEALMNIKDLFKTEFHQYWKVYDKSDFLSWCKKIGFIRKQLERE